MQVPPTNLTADHPQKVVHADLDTTVLSAKLFRNILWAFALCLFAGSLIDLTHSTNEQLPPQASTGRLAVSVLIALCGVLAHWKKEKPAFLLFSAVYLLALFNAAFVAGFGINSPALVIGLVPVLLALSLFERREALMWCIPIFLGWIAIAVVQFHDPTLFTTLISSTHGKQEPTAFAWATTCTLTIIPTIIITLSSRRQLEKTIAFERKLRADALALLDQQTKWSQERDDFMGHVSHELRTPLAAMRNALTLARHLKASDAIRERSLKTLDTSIGNMTALLDDVLDAFKYGSAGFNLRKAEFAPALLLAEVDALYTDLAQQKGLRLLIDASALTTHRLVGDPARLKQMLSNLVFNAIKFTPSGHIEVKLRKTDPVNSVWRFEVCDTGPGISPQDQTRLFKPFAQLADTQRKHTPETHGTGLGLSIVAQLAQAMGGHVGLYSQIGQGSTFYFDIPLPDADDAPAATAVALSTSPLHPTAVTN